MMRKLEESAADMVIGVRVNRHDTWSRKMQSKIGNGVRNWITNDHITDTGCSLKLVKREAIDRVRLYTGMHRFLPTLVRMQGYKVVEMPVNHRARQFGVSKYGAMNRAFRGLADCLAVRWMSKRVLRYEFGRVEVPAHGRQPQPFERITDQGNHRPRPRNRRQLLNRFTMGSARYPRKTRGEGADFRFLSRARVYSPSVLLPTPSCFFGRHDRAESTSRPENRLNALRPTALVAVRHGLRGAATRPRPRNRESPRPSKLHPMHFPLSFDPRSWHWDLLAAFGFLAQAHFCGAVHRAMDRLGAPQGQPCAGDFLVPVALRRHPHDHLRRRRRDPVIILGQAPALIVYIRNLMLIRSARAR